ncbi:MAG: hypothetical protein COB02_12620 [Candidatus Cloacimonadota bacterium]|nr:MAG: hypothetical protein COB02_12620 [Candidatus Cloacimonadota bacterium]
MMKLKQKAFTLIELMVVISLIGIMATWAVWSLRSTIAFYHQKQAAQLLSAAIRSAKSSALKSEVDERNNRLYDDEYKVSTRNAFAIFIYRGRLDEKDIANTVSDGVDPDDVNEAGYSLMIVNDNGLNTPDRVRSPLVVNASFTSLSAIDDLETRQYIINFPSDVVIKYAGDDENPSGADTSSNLLGDMTYWSYDRLGQLNTKMGGVANDPVDGLNTLTQTSLSNAKCYLVVMVGSAGVLAGEADEEYEPIYVDLRNGNIIMPEESNDFNGVMFPIFTNTP